MPLIGDLAVTTLILTVAIAARYVAIAWLVHALVWGRKDGRVRGRRLNRDRPKPATIRHELKLSLAVVLDLRAAGRRGDRGLEARRHARLPRRGPLRRRLAVRLAARSTCWSRTPTTTGCTG